jgi:hypothetical protein
MKQILIFSLILFVAAGCGQTGTVVESSPNFTPELRTPAMAPSFTNDSWLAAYCAGYFAHPPVFLILGRNFHQPISRFRPRWARFIF